MDTMNAIDRYQTRSGSSTRTIYYPGSPYVVTHPNPLVGVDSEIKPKTRFPGRDGPWRNTGAWEHYGVNVTLSRSSIKYRDGGVDVGVVGDILLLSDEFHRQRSVSQNSRNASLTRALANAQNEKVNLLVFLAELGRNVDMITKFALTISGQVKWFRRKFPRYWEQVLKYQIGGGMSHRRDLWCKIPHQWLELQYGWKPAMRDVVAMINRAAETAGITLPVVEAKGSFTDRYEALLKLHPNGWGGVPVDLSCHFKERAVTRLWFGIRDLNLKSASELGLVNVGSLVWEVLPASFIVDWALPIGQWLQAIGAPVGLDYIDGCTSSTVDVHYGEMIPRDVQNKLISFHGGGASGSEKHFERITHHVLPVPGVYVKNPITVGHAANALSLLAAAFTRPM